MRLRSRIALVTFACASAAPASADCEATPADLEQALEATWVELERMAPRSTLYCDKDTPVDQLEFVELAPDICTFRLRCDEPFEGYVVTNNDFLVSFRPGQLEEVAVIEENSLFMPRERWFAPVPQ